MKLLQIHAGYRTPAGEDTVVEAEASALRGAGHQVIQSIEHNPLGTVEALATLARSRYNRATERAVRDLCLSERPDVAHVHNTWFSQSTSVFDAVADIPLVMTVHNYRLGCIGSDLFRDTAVCTSCVGRSPLKGVVHGCYRDSRLLSAVAAVEVMSTRRRRALSHVDRFVAPSAFMADRLIDIGVPSERLSVKPHFIADPGPRHNAPSASQEVLYVGRLAAPKGVATLLRAWERHRSARPDARLVVIGDGPLLPELVEAAPRSVEFAGWMSHADVQQRMLGARAFVFPSEWYEPFGMVLIEAMAAGLPVIATTASDAVRITGTELVAPAGEDRAMAACLEQLEDRTVDELGARSRELFERTYTEAQGVRDLEALYEEVM